MLCLFSLVMDFSLVLNGVILQIFDYVFLSISSRILSITLLNIDTYLSTSSSPFQGATRSSHSTKAPAVEESFFALSIASFSIS